VTFSDGFQFGLGLIVAAMVFAVPIWVALLWMTSKDNAG
jgi:hypothetical protein